MANVLSRQKLKPLFIGFGKQANEYAKVLSFLNIKISAVLCENLNKDKSKIDRFKIKHRFPLLIKHYQQTHIIVFSYFYLGTQ